MTIVEQLAAFVDGATYGRLSKPAANQLKLCVLDALGCAIGALSADPIKRLGQDGAGSREEAPCRLIGGGRAALDRAAFYNGALVRYLDFNDSYLAPGETCHPSDNLGAVLAAAESAGASGSDLMTSLAVAYEVQCRLSEAAPVRDKGFDHATQGAFAVGAGVAKALGLSQAQTANAIAIAGTALNPLRVARTGTLSNWKGLAYPFMAMGATRAALLARQGITGPLEVFEGKGGFMDSISGPFQIDWLREEFEHIPKAILKKYNAEIHAQTSIEAALKLRSAQPFEARDVERIEVETFDVAYHIIGGGAEGDKTGVLTKEQADHSLPYIVAAAVLDGEMTTRQFLPERIRRPDVQTLLRRVFVKASPAFSRRFPLAMPCRLTIVLRNGEALTREQVDYEGFHTRPMDWEAVAGKFDRLTAPFTSAPLRQRIVNSVAALDTIHVSTLTGLLSEANLEPGSVADQNIDYEPVEPARAGTRL
jgi:2-methylcitrate dehydratase